MVLGLIAVLALLPSALARLLVLVLARLLALLPFALALALKVRVLACALLSGFVALL